jgi:hypothetical protein
MTRTLRSEDFRSADRQRRRGGFVRPMPAKCCRQDECCRQGEGRADPKSICNNRIVSRIGALHLLYEPTW